jgi:oligopeptide/dipeptide ABC transporter ATP-binding protein
MRDEVTVPEAARERPRPALLEAQRIGKVFVERRGVFRRHRLVRAVDGVSLRVREAEIMAIVGETGAGKTVLGRLLTRLLQPSYGRVLLDGRDITELDEAELGPLRQKLQYTFADAERALDPLCDVGSLLREPLIAHHAERSVSERDDRLRVGLERIGLSPLILDKYPADISPVEQKLVTILRPLLLDPRVTVCDEPFAPLQPDVRARILAWFEERRKNDASYVVLTRTIEAAASYAHRLAVMISGRIVEIGPTANVVSQPMHPYTRFLVGNRTSGEPAKRKLRIVLEPETKTSADKPAACVYFATCERAVPGRCDVEVPRLQAPEAGSRHRVACWDPY